MSEGSFANAISSSNFLFLILKPPKSHHVSRDRMD